jgi:Flp pilus assembly protein TadD
MQVKLNPICVDALCSRGSLKLLFADHEGGKRDFETALSIEPDFSIALYNLGTFYLNHENPVQAAKLLERALALEPKDSGIRLNYALALSDIGLEEAARNVIAADERLLNQITSGQIQRKV